MKPHVIDGVAEADFYRFCRQRRVALAVLFGSAASGRTTRHSDLDLAFWIEGKPVEGYDLDLTSGLMQLFHRNDVDVVLLNHANPLLQWQVASTGRPLYERHPGTFQRFQVTAFKRHHDAGRIYRWTRDYLEDVLAIGRHGRPAAR
jgi:predicted nucleotidyltransferase